MAVGSDYGRTTDVPTRGMLAGYPRVSGQPGPKSRNARSGAASTSSSGLPRIEAVDYAHKLGQSVIVWGALGVFAVMLARSRSRERLLRGLVSKHVAA